MASPFEFVTDRIGRALTAARGAIDGTSRSENPTFRGGGRRFGAAYTVRGNLKAVRSRTTSVFAQRQSKKARPLIDTPPTPFLDVADDE